MRVTLLTQWFDPEPVATPGLSFASWLVGRGHEVNVIAGVPNYPSGHLYPGYRMRVSAGHTEGGVKVVRVPVYPSHDLSAIRRTANYTSYAISASAVALGVMRKSDVIYVRTPPTTAIPALLSKRLYGVPFLYHIVDLWPESATESGMIRSSSFRRAAGSALSALDSSVCRASAAIVVSAPGYKRILIARGVSDAKIEVIYNWAEEAMFRPTEKDPELAEGLGLNGRFVVMYAGNVGDYQGLEAAILAARDLLVLEAFRLVIVGDGNAANSLRSYAKSVGADNVVFLGRQPFETMGRVMSLADVQLVSLKDLPLFSMTIPGKTQAALAAGQPVLMAVRGDAADLITYSGAGLACQPGNPSAIAAAFRELYSLPKDDLVAMGSRGRDLYLSQLSLESAGPRFEALMVRFAKR